MARAGASAGEAGFGMLPGPRWPAARDLDGDTAVGRVRSNSVWLLVLVTAVEGSVSTGIVWVVPDPADPATTEQRQVSLELFFFGFGFRLRFRFKYT